MTYGPEEIKGHKEFIKDGLVDQMDAVLSDPARAAVLKFPAPGDTHIDIVV
jgi:hypothetical protein